MTSSNVFFFFVVFLPVALLVSNVSSTPPLANRSAATTAVRSLADPSGKAATTASTYALLRPFTTRHRGRSTTLSRWWFTQNRIRVMTGNAMVSRSEQLQMAAHIGTT